MATIPKRRKGGKSTIGTDPEFLLIEKGTGRLVSAVGKVPGSKLAPIPMKDSQAGLQTDNVAVEVATYPTENGPEFITRLRQTLVDLKKFLPADCTLSTAPSGNYDESELQSEQAQAIGCTPDYDVYTMSEIHHTFDGDPSFRSAGGHVHVGSSGDDGNEAILEYEGKFRLVKCLDATLGLAFTLIDNSEAAIKRRNLYGKAGAHRPTDYGVEYRVLSNFWMTDPVYATLVKSLVEDSLALMRAGKDEELIRSITEERLVATINSGNSDDATAIIDEFIRPIMSEFSAEYFQASLETSKAEGPKKGLFEAWSC